MDNDLVHVYPLNDLREHDLKADCWCNPVINDEGVCVHNSMDQREKYESGELKPH
ncbi:hypothetical protein [Pasteurella multocida]|uniref:hypothetical protein n=1 Tax=Pasteurella multocida TaxID=747 RepID=UPI000DA27A3A|nr:hypothetical protein [Pasteurella multocida]WRK02046.1 hypothetical protein RFF39_05355 [Pasteurella multocida]SQI48207.1 Uncharacterised protein [Pasteurella multocida]SUB38293.1 Uncharacterised protein [Pasteurella multocida]HDR0635836.1 hypothetical protein [Pasteurella multocida]